MKFIRKNAVSCIMLSSFLSISTYANPLKTILQQNLSNAPEVKE
ncbi:hypothetical protein HPSSW114_0539, partial [Glaesserella parasuis SW114]